MALTLRELLSFEVVRDACPQVLAGADDLDRPVGWVHSSEIYEIWPLLSGGELLLTTGLGLAGPDAGARRHYVRQLAGTKISGLVLELGRTFTTVPPELVEEAAAAGLPLIALGAVVPFIRISQAVNTAIVEASAGRLARGQQITEELNEALADGAGVGGLLAVAGARSGGPLVVLSAGGALLAASGVSDHRQAWSVVDQARAAVPITVHGQLWGRLLAGTARSGPDCAAPLAGEDLADLLRRTASGLSLAVLLTGRPPSRPDRQAASLLGDLLEARPADADYRLRSGMLGFHPAGGQWVVAIAVDGPESSPALMLVDRLARALATPRLAGRVGQHVLGLLIVAPRQNGEGRDPVGAVAAAVEEIRSSLGVPELTVAIGHPVLHPGGHGAPGADPGAEEIAASLRAARRALRLAVAERAGRPGGAPAVVTARELAMELQLTGSGDGHNLRTLARATLGPLIDWDATHRSELVRTLEVFLRHGGSPTRASAALHLGRQSLYQRIDRIETLLGHPVDDARLHAALLQAACAHRLSTH